MLEEKQNQPAWTTKDVVSNFFKEQPNYSPLCYFFEGTPPLLLTNKQCGQPFVCILISDAIVAILYHLTFKLQSHPQDFLSHRLAIYLSFGVTNICYLLTQFLNPGLMHPLPQQIPDSQQPTGRTDSNPIQSCMKCPAQWRASQRNRVRHCDQCQVCIKDIDHHCGWFGKCVAGPTTFTYYVFVLGIFVEFAALIAYAFTVTKV